MDDENVGRLGLEKLIDVKEGKQYVPVFAGQKDGSRSFAPATALAQSRIYLFARDRKVACSGDSCPGTWRRSRGSEQ
jgi:hypothetical protein